MMIWGAEFYLPNYVLLRQMSKMSFHFQSRHWWDSRNGAGRRSSDTCSARAGWKMCDSLIIRPTSVHKRTLSTNYVQTSRTGGVWTYWCRIVTKGGMRLTALPEHSLSALGGASHTPSQDSLRAILAMTPKIKAPQSQSHTSIWTQVPRMQKPLS